VQAMIDAALEPVWDTVNDAFRPGDVVGLQASGGKLLCAEQGGPVVDGQPFTLTGRSSMGVWESYTLKKGVPPPTKA